MSRTLPLEGLASPFGGASAVRSTAAAGETVSLRQSRVAKPDHRHYLLAGDEWLVVYASLPSPTMIGPRLFTIGHALELYLKAVFVKHTGEMPAKHHNVAKFWRDAKARSHGGFMPAYEVRDHLLDWMAIHGDLFKYLYEKERPEEELKHFSSQSEFYVVLNSLADMKYYGVPSDTLPKGLVVISENPWWGEFFKQLRQYVGWPQPGVADRIRDHVNVGGLRSQSLAFLQQLY